ncbi:MAG: YjbQ family protein [Candidatus Omnitrophota bacterium]|jgi:secondary thiamine-phosphate synthase enzyme|nr:MAG: YjbQ family protein [Candidatus Omnitrophota bacterium]
MQIKTERIRVSTKGNTDIIDLTPQITKIVSNSGMTEGQVTVFVPGATGGLSTVEYEPGLLQDIPDMFEKIAPKGATYHHDMTWHDGNGHSHLRATLVGPSLTIPFEKKTLTLGTWQQVILLDFDNRARDRSIVVQLIGE